MLIYEKATHSLLNTNPNITGEVFSFCISITLELWVEYSTGKCLGLDGFFPLINAKHIRLELPTATKNGYAFSPEIISDAKLHMTYDLKNKKGEILPYFSTDNLAFDETQGIIRSGIDTGDLIYCRIDPNVIAGINEENEIQCFYIKPNEFV